ncbi:MAG: YigZ family protein [Bifidobacteriaceae bacterium]|jgi:putative IMPACT (imprinted ancient) family translation regulator|nr:YigZ family protein [Bifidobacteriaceae bacterium]
MPLAYLADEVTSEEIIKKSRFITRLFPVADPEAAKARIAAVRRRDHGARHHAYAMVIGSDAAVQRSSDDAEPAGTAGVPMLEVLRREQVTDILAVSTRYFGGVLLGRGGLIRAYAGGVATALSLARLHRDDPRLRLGLAVPAGGAGRAENLLRDWAAANPAVGIGQVVYGEVTTVEVELPPDLRPELEAALAGAGLRPVWTVLLGRDPRDLRGGRVARS